MGLRIVYGKAGVGKSNFIFEEISNKIKNNEKNKIYIITPEQFSFTAEKKLMQNKKSVINAEVITFNRMAYRVQNEIGGIINNNLTKCGKAMLIYSILQNEKSEFNLLNKSDENINLAMRTISEFKKNKIEIPDLKNVDLDPFIYWKEGYFYFDNTPLSAVMKELGRWYNINVIFENKELMDLKIRYFCVRNETLERAVTLLNHMKKIKVSISGNTVYLR